LKKIINRAFEIKEIIRKRGVLEGKRDLKNGGYYTYKDSSLFKSFMRYHLDLIRPQHDFKSKSSRATLKKNKKTTV